jgi:hypothetical protein
MTLEAGRLEDERYLDDLKALRDDDPNDPVRAPGKGPLAWWDNSSCRIPEFRLPDLAGSGIAVPQLENRVALLDRLDEGSHKHASKVSEDLKYSARECIERIGNEALYYLGDVLKEKVHGVLAPEDLSLFQFADDPGTAFEILKNIPDESVALVFTSPPFALRRQKAYGNVPVRALD